MSNRLRQHLARRRGEAFRGVTSVCSAHPLVLRAAAEEALQAGSPLLLEATSNQVNQFGGYTGMRPEDFRRFAMELVEQAGHDPGHLTLGGDHLGPNPWRTRPAEEAMQLAEAMVAQYVAAGFSKIHLDASMPLGGDPEVLSDEQVAARAVRLCRAAEAAVPPGAERPVYVIGTEVPVPGGATHHLSGVEVTSPAAASKTIDVHRQAFLEAGLHEAWERVLAAVVQPGVEFGHDSVVEYDRSRSRALTALLQDAGGGMVFEAHSTDYQRPGAYRELVQDGFAILKVGPALTFALREALFGLAAMERLLVADDRQSQLAAVVDEAMLREPKDWLAYYPGSAAEQRTLRVYSYSDRMRYYWNRPAVARAVQQLLDNLAAVSIPETMLSQHLPLQYQAVREGRVPCEPVALVVDAVREVLRMYYAACSSQT